MGLAETRCRVAALGAVLLFQAVFPAGGANSARDPVAVIDSLLTANRFDSVLVVTPALLDEALAGGDSLRYGRLLIARGRAQLARGRYADGLASIDLSLEVSRSIGDTLGRMSALGFKGFALAWQGRYEECLRLNGERLALARSTGNRSSEGWARTAMGYVYLQQGDLDSARTEYALAADLFRAEGMRQAELTPLIGLGRVYNVLQDADAARTCYQRALVTAREIGDLAQESHAVNNLGTLEYVYGDMNLAEQYFERAYELSMARGTLREAITPASNIAMARAYLGSYEEAAAILMSAIRTCEEQNFRDLLGQVTNKLGEVRLTQKRMNAAARLYRRSLALGDALSDKQRHDAVLGLAEALAGLDSTAAAVDLLREDLGRSRLPEYRVGSALLLSRYLREQGFPAEALAALAEAREQYGVTESTNQRIFTALELGAAFRDAGRLAEASEWFARSVELMDERRLATEEYRWREVNTGNWLLLDQCRIILEYPPDRPEEERIAALFDVLQRFKARTLLERITEPRRRDDPSFNLSKQPTITLAELQQTVLEPGELFLDFVAGDAETFLFAVTADSCRLVSLPGRSSGFAGRAALYCGSLGARPRDGSDGDVQAGLDAMHEAVGDSILGRVADMILASKRVIVAPDQYLNSIPFGVLAPARTAGAGGPLCLSREIHRVPSATVLRWLRTKRRDGETPDRSARILAVAPVDGAELKGARREIGFLRDGFAGVDLARGGRKAFLSGEGSYDIIHVATHIEVDPEKAWHSGILVENGDRLRAGEEAAEGVVPAGAASGAAGEYRPDPYIRAGEIAAGRIPARLVVLSGCESARGQALVGEGVVGLTAAFLGAGAGAVVATLWPVDDAVTTDLMKAFYGGLAQGNSAAASLRQAQLELRGRGKTRHPFYWAGFVVIGDGATTVRLEQRGMPAPLRYTVMTVVLIALVAVVLFSSGAPGMKKSDRRV